MHTIIIIFFLSCLSQFICTSDGSAFSRRPCSTDSNQVSLEELIRNTDSPKSVLERPKSNLDVDQDELKAQQVTLKSCLKSVSSIRKNFPEPVLRYYTPEKCSLSRLECIQNKVENSAYSQITADLKEGFETKKDTALLVEWVKRKQGDAPVVGEKVWNAVLRSQKFSFEELDFVRRELTKQLNVMRVL